MDSLYPFASNFSEGEDADDEYEFPDEYTMTPEMLEELLEFEMRATAVTSASGMSHFKFLEFQLTDSSQVCHYYHVTPKVQLQICQPCRAH